MKKLLPAFVVIAALSVELHAAGPASRIGYVKMSRLLSESAEARQWAAKIETLRQERQRDLTAQERDLQQTRVALAQAGGLFSASKRATLQQQEARQRAELERSTRQAQADIQALQRQMQDTLRGEWNAILDDLAKERGLEMVVNQETTVVWAPSGQDLTDLVLKRLAANSPEGRPAATSGAATRPPTNQPSDAHKPGTKQ